MDQAACQKVGGKLKRNEDGKPIDPFFPEPGEDKSAGAMMCFECPVTKKCDSYANIIAAKIGVWGGKYRK
jgi:hypothetical protein